MTDRANLVRTALLVVAGTLLSSCTPGEIEEDDFARRFAQAMCAQERECARGAWLNRYYGQADCVATWENALQDVVALYDDLDCDYSKKQAADTFDDLSSADCEEFYEDYIHPDNQDPSPLEEIWDLEDCGSNPSPTYFPSGSSQ